MTYMNDVIVIYHTRYMNSG